MNEVRSNSAAEVEALLEQAKNHIARGNEYHRKAREAIVAVRQIDPKISNRRIATALGCSHRWVNALLKWDGTDGSTPFAGTQYVKADADDSGIDHEPLAVPVLRNLDVIEMGDHVLVVGNATRGHIKLMALERAGLPYLREFFDADEEGSDGSGLMDVVVVSDPPYGQKKQGILNDDRADWGEVYQLFKPRGGFAFCAFHPPIFRAAEGGMSRDDFKPKHYLVFDKGGGRIWGGDRLQNTLDAIIYFERGVEQPWEAGRHAISVLRKPKSKAATEELKQLGGGSETVTPKPPRVLIQLIELCTDPGGIVLDPFTGSGTTLIACCRTGRRFIGVELLPENAELAVRNWMRETGREAIVHREFADEPIGFHALEANPSYGDYVE